MKKFFTALVMILFLSSSISAESFMDQFKDPMDGALDSSEWLVEKSGFLPVPIFITEPAVGFGAGVALLFFHKSRADKLAEKEATEDEMLRLPPSVSAVAGAYTENDSWFVGGGHFGSWWDDRVRYIGGLGGASVNLKFYGAGINPGIGQGGIQFNIDGGFLLQELTFRIPRTKLFVGGRYEFISSDVNFDLSDIIPGIPPAQLDSKDAGLALIANYDSRDNIFTPNRGHLAKLNMAIHDEAIGGDFEYNKTRTQWFAWWPGIPKVTVGTRLDYWFTNGDTPFWALPYIDLQGIPVLRYQGENVFVGEIRPRWDFRFRWSLVGFIGAGWAADSVSNFSGSEAQPAGGLGIRYFLARRLGLRVGLDIARGPEETAIYIIVGNAWQ